MLRRTIDYGIDLGTTNSSIGRIENGQVRILKNPETQMDTTPSAVFFSRNRQMFMGSRAYDKIGFDREDRENTYIEFKREMGFDKRYHTSRMNCDYGPEDLSAEVLKYLKSFIPDEEEVNAAVITVPADFNQTQISATQRAAKLAGFTYFELLQEPIAASIAYGIDKRDYQGHWLVFDFGGGTYDAALVKMEEGIIKVIDHEGIKDLGGKDMDWLIVDRIIIPKIREQYDILKWPPDGIEYNNLRWAWKYYAERAKIDLSLRNAVYIDQPQDCKDDLGNIINMSINLKRDEFEALINSMIDDAIRLANKILSRNGLVGSDLETVLMVGGPTYIPFLRERVKSEISSSINVSIDPMTAVTRGAVIFASTRHLPNPGPVNDGSVQLILGHTGSTRELETALGVKIDRKNSKNIPAGDLFVEVERADNAWKTGKIMLQNDSTFVSLRLIDNQISKFIIHLCDSMGNNIPCQPDSLSIRHGKTIANPPLPHDIGISSSIVNYDSSEIILVPILEKNSILPAVGTQKFVTQKMIRPGNAEDILRIEVYEGDKGTFPSLNDFIDELIISGDKIPALIPEGSDIEVTMRVDVSRQLEVSIFIPYIDETIRSIMNSLEKEILLEEIEELIRNAHALIEFNRQFCNENQLECDYLLELQDEFEDIVLKDNNYLAIENRASVRRRLKELSKELYNVEKDLRWPKLEAATSNEAKDAKDIVERFGNEKEELRITELENRLKQVVSSKDAKFTGELGREMQRLKWDILFRQRDYWIGWLNRLKENYDNIAWINRDRAKSMINKGVTIITEHSYTDELPKIVYELWGLMPEESVEDHKVFRDDIPRAKYGHQE